MSGATASGGVFSPGRVMAGPGFSRWMVPPAALCVHLCIGQAYAFSVYMHNLWAIYFGYGVFGGIGLGIGYI